MRIAFDATPAAVQRAGVGRYARELLKALVALPEDDEYSLVVAATQSEANALLDELPPGALRETKRLPFDQRAMTIAWQRARAPLAVERFVGAFDVFHATDFVAPPTRSPTVVTVHDLSFLLAPEYGEPSLVSYLRRALPRTLAKARAVIAVSSSVAAEIADAYPTLRHKVVAAPNGVARPAPGYLRDEQPHPVILSVGTLEPRKNHLALFRAMDQVRSAFPDARLVVAGRAGWRSEQIVDQLLLRVAKGQADWVDAPTDRQLDAIFASATLLVVPSHYEGFGLPILEAFARGVPVVASDIPSLRETGGDVARYGDPADPESIAHAIIALLNDPAERVDRATRGYERAERFTWQETARRTRRVYRLATEETFHARRRY